MIRQMFRFSLIGLAATLVHLFVGVTLIDAGWMPVVANLAAFCTAFLVSFAGHFGYTFSSHQVALRTSLRRFIVVALAGFCTNETMLLILLAQNALAPQVG